MNVRKRPDPVGRAPLPASAPVDQRRCFQRQQRLVKTGADRLGESGQIRHELRRLPLFLLVWVRGSAGARGNPLPACWSRGQRSGYE